MALVRYIGSKPTKEDNVAHTKTVWPGPGTDREVPDGVAVELLKHPTVWQLVTEDMQRLTAPALGSEPEPPAMRFVHAKGDDNPVYALRDTGNDEITDLTNMTDAELKAFARVNGIKADLRKRGDELKATIVATVIAATERPPEAKE